MDAPGPVRRRQCGVGRTRPTVQRASLPLPLPIAPTATECAALLKALIKHLLFQRAQIPYLYDELLRAAQAQQQAAAAAAAEAAAGGDRRRRRRSPKSDKRLLKVCALGGDAEFLDTAEELMASIDVALAACGVPRRALLMLGASSTKPREVFEVLLPHAAPATVPQGTAAVAAAAAASGVASQQQCAAAQEAEHQAQAASRARPSRQQRLCQLAVRHLVVGAAELPEGTAHTVPCKLFVLLEGPPVPAAGPTGLTDAAADAAVVVPSGFTAKRQFRFSMRKGTHVRLLLGPHAEAEEERQAAAEQQPQGEEPASGEASMDGSGSCCDAGEGQAEAGTVHLSQLPDADSQGSGQQPSLPPAGAATAAPASSSTAGSVWFMARTVLKGLNSGSSSSSSGGVAAGFDGL